MSRVIAYTFKAVRRDGSRERGVIEAATREAAVALLGSRGIFAIEVAEPRDGERRSRAVPLRRSLSPRPRLRSRRLRHPRLRLLLRLLPSLHRRLSLRPICNRSRGIGRNGRRRSRSRSR